MLFFSLLVGVPNRPPRNHFRWISFDRIKDPFSFPPFLTNFIFANQRKIRLTQQKKRLKWKARGRVPMAGLTGGVGWISFFFLPLAMSRNALIKFPSLIVFGQGGRDRTRRYFNNINFQIADRQKSAVFCPDWPVDKRRFSLIWWINHVQEDQTGYKREWRQITTTKYNQSRQLVHLF